MKTSQKPTLPKKVKNTSTQSTNSDFRPNAVTFAVSAAAGVSLVLLSILAVTHS